MYDYIQGIITELSPAHAVVEAGGVGYYLTISLQTFSDLENAESARVYTHFVVREDAQLLYGFSDRRERELFRLLISVSGVGGNIARTILSTYSPAELGNIISSDNAALLKNVKGLGLKTAQKIIVELRDKITGFAADAGQVSQSAGRLNEEVHAEALAALGMLGFSKSASDKAVRAVLKDNPQAAVEEVIRLALKKI